MSPIKPYLMTVIVHSQSEAQYKYSSGSNMLLINAKLMIPYR